MFLSIDRLILLYLTSVVDMTFLVLTVFFNLFTIRLFFIYKTLHKTSETRISVTAPSWDSNNYSVEEGLLEALNLIGQSGRIKILHESINN